MAKQILSDKTLRSVKPSNDQRFNDGGGLYLLIKTNGAKWWRFDYSIEGKRKTLSLGVYPVIGLANARRKAEDARKQIKNDQRQAAENENRLDKGLPLLNSFEYVAREWFASIAHTINKTTHQKKIRRFEAHVFPIIGGITLSEIKSPVIYSLIKPLAGKLETAHRVHSEISAIYSYAIAHGLTENNPALSVSAQLPAKKVKHRAALTDPQYVAKLIRDIDVTPCKHKSQDLQTSVFSTRISCQ